VIGSIILLALSFAVLLAGAYIFTNAVEWAGVRLNLGHGAVGSVLAAVATAMPESLIPVVAIISGEQTGEIAIGAIIGAPFLLGTLAMAIVGIAVYTRPKALVHTHPGNGQERTELDVDRRSATRDLGFFLAFFALAVGFGLFDSKVVHIVAAVALVAAYGVYLWRTIVAHRVAGGDQEPPSLYFDPTKGDPPGNSQVIAQIVVGLAMIVGGAQLFVTEVETLAHDLGIAALVLALVLAPLASELPEKLNSVLWVRQGKDTLAMGNITGAMVFQSSFPVTIGLLLTPWRLTGDALVAAIVALVAGAVLWITLRLRGSFDARLLLVQGAFFGGFAAYVLTRL
jgi:cation:H+ antiporter